jgi:agmatine/peptidylarginine deiminase
VQVPFDTVWVRDYGPITVHLPDGSFRWMDGDYGQVERANDDAVPSAIAPQLGTSSVAIPLAVEGGNLLSNGGGLFLTTTAMLETNFARNYKEPEIAQLLRRHYGAEEVVFLEPLLAESTGHVDMFATFTSVDTVVVGEYSAESDPINADTLNRNAARLAGLQTSRGPLKVIRIPMPPVKAEIFRTYTNVLYANGTALVPIYPGLHRRGQAAALATYRQLLPDWSVVGIDCNELIMLGGAVHCISLNVSKIGHLPESSPAFRASVSSRLFRPHPLFGPHRHSRVDRAVEFSQPDVTLQR